MSYVTCNNTNIKLAVILHASSTIDFNGPEYQHICRHRDYQRNRIWKNVEELMDWKNHTVRLILRAF